MTDEESKRAYYKELADYEEEAHGIPEDNAAGYGRWLAIQMAKSIKHK